MLGELNPCGGGDPIPLLKTKLLIGRRSSCDVSLKFPNVSSHHCELELLNGYWFVRDLTSRNGIKVNGVRCESKWLMPGDVLSVAKHRYEVGYIPQGDAPPPEEEDPFAIGLLEKAGLARRSDNPPARSSQGETPGNGSLEPESEQADEIDQSDDDLAMNWLIEPGA